MIITDTNIIQQSNNDCNLVEADGIFVSDGMLTEDNKKNKKTKNIIMS